MIPFKSVIIVDRNKKLAVYLQICNAIINAIKKGVLATGTKLPGSRSLANLLLVNRNTIVRVYEELLLQGWIEVVNHKGFIISNKIPMINLTESSNTLISQQNKVPINTGYEINAHSHISIPEEAPSRDLIQLNDGFPDARLAPLDALAREYRAVLRKPSHQNSLNYNHPQGNKNLREQLRQYLQNSRGINASIDQILITRGSLMGISLLISTLINKGDKVVVGKTNYRSADMLIKQMKGEIIRIRVDNDGLDINELEIVCKKQKIRAIYIASHHHHPTTVVLSAARRIKLHGLAKKYKFAIIEDDYDYDFHYNSSPILPLASSDPEGFVSYVGSLSKTICPAFRIGFVVAPQNLINALTRLRRIIDRQGDFVLEEAMANLFKEGEIFRHLRKSLRIYHQRRDIFCHLLSSELNQMVSFEKPEGGLAVWAKFSEKIDLVKTRHNTLKKGLHFNDGSFYDPEKLDLNSTRLGFASLNNEELSMAVGILKKALVFF